MSSENILVVGIIGCGMVADFHIKNFNTMSSVIVKWLCDSSEKTLEKSVNKYNIKSGTNDYRDVTGDPEVDAITICTPPITHYEITKNAIQNNKHILIEKPIAIIRNEVNELYEMAKNHPNLLIMDTSARHSRLQPKYSHIKNIINGGDIGDIYHIHHSAIYNKSRPGIEYHSEARWFFDKKKSGGGPFIDWGVYDLSFHLGLLSDKPKLLNLSSSFVKGLDNESLFHYNYTVEEHGIAFMEFDTGLTYYWERATNAHNEETNITKIYGTKGGLKFSYPTWESTEIYFYNLNDRKIEGSYNIPMMGHVSDADDYIQLDYHFIECILNKKIPILGMDISVKHMNIIFDAYAYSSKDL